MAVQPLFISTVDNLRARLRLSSAQGNEDLPEILDEAMQTARVGIYERLGASVVSSIAATTATENPVTQDQITRTKAEILEVSWVRMILLRRLPVLFMDAGAATREIWDTEGMTRDAKWSEIDREIGRLLSEIESLLGSLAGDSESGPTGRAVAFEPQVTKTPGFSIGRPLTGGLR